MSIENEAAPACEVTILESAKCSTCTSTISTSDNLSALVHDPLLPPAFNIQSAIHNSTIEGKTIVPHPMMTTPPSPSTVWESWMPGKELLSMYGEEGENDGTNIDPNLIPSQFEDDPNDSNVIWEFKPHVWHCDFCNLSSYQSRSVQKCISCSQYKYEFCGVDLHPTKPFATFACCVCVKGKIKK